MAKPMILKAGQKMNLPGNATFSGGLGWSGDADLDLWFLRRRAGTYGVVAWCNKDWHRPDLGVNRNPQTGEELPFIAPPEEDIVHCGDDRTGATSAVGYDEKFTLVPSKAPADVDEYIAFATIYDENDESATLGVASDIVCGVKKDGTEQELKTEVANEFGFDVTARVVKWTKNAAGVWTMANDSEGYGSDDIFTVLEREYKVVFPAHWQNN